MVDALSRLEHEKTLNLDESEEIGQNNNPANPIAAFRPPEAATLVASRDDWSMEEFMKAQQRDALLTKINDIVGMNQVGPRVDMENQSKMVKTVQKENLTWSPEGVLQRIATSGLLQNVLPSTLGAEILRLAYDEPFSGHQGVKQTLQRILQSFWRPTIKDDAARYTHAIMRCLC